MVNVANFGTKDVMVILVNKIYKADFHEIENKIISLTILQSKTPINEISISGYRPYLYVSPIDIDVNTYTFDDDNALDINGVKNLGNSEIAAIFDNYESNPQYWYKIGDRYTLQLRQGLYYYNRFGEIPPVDEFGTYIHEIFLKYHQSTINWDITFKTFLEESAAKKARKDAKDVLNSYNKRNNINDMYNLNEENNLNEKSNINNESNINDESNENKQNNINNLDDKDISPFGIVSYRSIYKPDTIDAEIKKNMMNVVNISNFDDYIPKLDNIIKETSKEIDIDPEYWNSIYS